MNQMLGLPRKDGTLWMAHQISLEVVSRVIVGSIENVEGGAPGGIFDSA